MNLQAFTDNFVNPALVTAEQEKITVQAVHGRLYKLHKANLLPDGCRLGELWEIRPYKRRWDISAAQAQIVTPLVVELSKSRRSFEAPAGMKFRIVPRYQSERFEELRRADPLRIINSKEAAALAQVTVFTIGQWRKKGRLIPADIGYKAGEGYYYSVERLQRAVGMLPVTEVATPAGITMDKAQRAFELLFEWCENNRDRFSHQFERTAGDVVGRWIEGEGVVYVLPYFADQVLKRQGFQIAETLRYWRDAGWIETAKDQLRNTKQIRVIRGGDAVRVYALRIPEKKLASSENNH